MNPTPYHPPLTIGGTTYTFDHLEPHDLLIHSVKAAKELRIHLRYMDHCFTCGYDPALHANAVVLPGKRVFDLVRYTLSKDLPGYLQRLPGSNVRQTTSRRNWLHSITIQSGAGPYHVFFELRKAAKDEKQDLNLKVESAYPQAGQAAPQLLGQMGFELLAGKIYRGEPTTTRR